MSGPLRLTVDKTSPVPLYHQVAQGLENAIRSLKLDLEVAHGEIIRLRQRP